jgi:hypothetical protein
MSDDLLLNPEAVPQRRTTGTTSRGGTFADIANQSGASVNQYEYRQRQREAAQVTAKPPMSVWEVDYWRQKAKEKADEQRRAQAQAERHKKEAAVVAHNQKLRQFQANQIILDGIYADHGLTEAERRRVAQRLADGGNLFNFDSANVYCQEIVFARKKA